MPDIHALLWPKSVAVIGASADTSGLRGRIMRVIGSHDFEGAVYPVSRSGETIAGRKSYRSVAEVPEPVDLAVLIVPARFVPDALAECAGAGAKAAHILASGFAEEPGETGSALQARVREIAAAHDMAVCGPNSIGFANLEASLCATFSPTVDTPDLPLLPAGRDDGMIAVIAQSGGLGFSFYDRGRPKELPFNYVVTTGNEACLNSLDLLDHMLDEGRSEVFILFLEDLKRPERLAPVAAKAARAGKPIIAAKIGQSEAGRRAALSHTAALAGSRAGYRAMFRRYGIIEGGDIEEMVDIAAGFSRYRTRLPAGPRVGIFTPSGGAGGWMADCCAQAGLEVPELDADTRAAIAPHLPDYGATGNPVDVTAQAIWRLGHARLAEMVAASDRVDSVIVVTSARNAGLFERDGEALTRLARRTEKPILFSTYTLPRPDTVRAIAGAGYPLYTNMRNCARAMAEMAGYRAFRERFLRPHRVETTPLPDRGRAAKLLAQAGSVLCEYEAGPVFAAYGVAAGKGCLVNDAAAAVAAAAGFAAPVALKVQSPDIPHKAEAGAVQLDVTGSAAVRRAHGAVIESAAAFAPNADVRGVLVQPMAPPGVEMIVGIQRDETFGPMLMAGFGGAQVEVAGDVGFTPIPVRRDDCRALLDRLRLRRRLDGARGAPPADIDALIDVMVAVAALAADHEAVVDQIDLNPAIVHPSGRGVSIVDAVIVKR